MPSSGHTPSRARRATNCGPVTRSNHAGPVSTRRPPAIPLSVGSRLPIRMESTSVSSRAIVTKSIPSRQSGSPRGRAARNAPIRRGRSTNGAAAATARKARYVPPTSDRA